MACDFCEEKTCLFQSEFKLWMKNGTLYVAGRFGQSEKHDINHCLMCGDDMALKRIE